MLALTRRLRGAEAQRVALLQRAVDASSDERRRIAASLHDGPVQELAATSFTVAGASASATRNGDAALARDLDAAASAVRASIRSLRTLLVDLHPPALSRSGVVAALADLAQSVRAEDVVVRLETDTDDELALTEDAQRLVHRVAQECVRNAATHAGPAEVVVALHRTGPGTVTLDVVDDGRGFDVEDTMSDPEPGHLGTQLLAGAASVPGAQLRVATAPGAGTHWRLDLDGPMGCVHDPGARRRRPPARQAGVRTLLDAEADITVVAEARDGAEAIESAVGTEPDVVLMDLSMPGVDGVEGTRGVLARCPGTRVLVLTSFSDRERVREVLAAGAIGYLLKDSEPAELLAAVRAAAAGHVPIDPRVAGALLPPPATRSGTPTVGLAPRETEVLALVAQGLANK